MKKRNCTVLLILITAISFASCGDAFARRGGGFSSSSRSWGSSRSSSSSRRSASSRSSSWRKSGWGGGGSSKSKNRPKLSKADQQLYAKAAANGTAFRSKADAMSHFSREQKGLYTQKAKPGQPAPAHRPDYIPKTTKVGGRTYDVTYDVKQGGYGYWMGGGPGTGRWVMYDPMVDPYMMTMLMSRNSYYYGPQPSRWSMRWWLTPALVLTLGALVVFLVVRGAGSDYAIA